MPDQDWAQARRLSDRSEVGAGEPWDRSGLGSGNKAVRHIWIGCGQAGRETDLDKAHASRLWDRPGVGAGK